MTVPILPAGGSLGDTYVKSIVPLITSFWGLGERVVNEYNDDATLL